MAGSIATDPAIRFARYYQAAEPGCWEWQGGLFKDSGYGKFNGGKSGSGKRLTVLAHRFAFELHIGPIPEGLSVLHRCDNRVCVNPGHLFLGTQLDNIHDMFGKGRARPQGKLALTSADTQIIRASPRGASKTLAQQFGVSTAHIRRIRQGKSLRLKNKGSANA